MSSGSGSLPELIEKAPARSLRQILGASALWTAVAATAGVAVALALVVAPGRDESAAAAQQRTVPLDAIVPVLAAASAPAAARENAAPAAATPSAARTAAVSRDGEPTAERPAADRLAAIHNPQSPRQHRRVVARGYRDRFQLFGHAFAWSSSRNRWR